MKNRGSQLGLAMAIILSCATGFAQTWVPSQGCVIASSSNALLAIGEYAAISAVCLQSLSSAYTFQKEIFENQDKLKTQSEAFLHETAGGKIGANINQMKVDMNGATFAQSVASDQQLGGAHHFNGTPSFMIGLEPVVGSLPNEEFKRIVDKQLGE